MLRKLCLLGSVIFAAALSLAAAQDSRHFTFHYAFTVKNVPAGQKIRIWIPEAHSDAYQEVKVVSARGDLPLKQTSESKYGNQIYYAETVAAQPELHFDIEYEVTRHGRLALGSAAHVISVSLSSAEKRQDLSPTRWYRLPACLPISLRKLPRQDSAAGEGSCDLRLRVHHHALRQDRHWLGAWRRSLCL